MSWFSNLFKSGEREPQIITKEVRDPALTAVANPLSSFLSSKIGQGVERYTGDLAPKDYLDPRANEYFDKYVGDPATKKFKEEFLPVIQEGYAGALRGSGRFRSEEDNINKFSTDLAGLRYQANLDFGDRYYKLQDTKIQREYADWFKSLPEMNPILDKALQFLSSGETGLTVFSGLDPGKKGWFGDLLNTSIEATASVLGGK